MHVPGWELSTALSLSVWKACMHVWQEQLTFLQLHWLLFSQSYCSTHVALVILVELHSVPTRLWWFGHETSGLRRVLFNVCFVCAERLLESFLTLQKSCFLPSVSYYGMAREQAASVWSWWRRKEGKWRREGGTEKRPKVAKTWHQSTFFQLNMFWQLTGEASYYEKIKGKKISSSFKDSGGECQKQSVLKSSPRILARSFCVKQRPNMLLAAN